MPAYETQAQTLAIDGIQLHVAIAGEPAAPALLLLHGLYDRQEVWEPVIPDLAAAYRVIAPDLRGHSRSSKPKRGYDLTDYAADMLALVAALEIPQVVPVGHSLGALVAAYFAADYPDRVRGLVLVDPPFEQNEQTRQWLEILLDAKRGTIEETYETVKELNILTGDETEWRRQADWLHATADGPFEAMIDLIDAGRAEQYYETLERINCPVLLLQADPRSGGALSDAAAAMALERMHNVEHHMFHHTGHSIHLEQTSDFVQVVREFLERLS